MAVSINEMPKRTCGKLGCVQQTVVRKRSAPGDGHSANIAQNFRYWTW
jgi:hypothetical protein